MQDNIKTVTDKFIGATLSGFGELAVVIIERNQDFGRDYLSNWKQRGRSRLTMSIGHGLGLDSESCEAIKGMDGKLLVSSEGLKDVIQKKGKIHPKLIDSEEALDKGIAYLSEAQSEGMIEAPEDGEALTEAVIAYANHQQRSPLVEALALTAYEALKGEKFGMAPTVGQAMPSVC